MLIKPAIKKPKSIRLGLRLVTQAIRKERSDKVASVCLSVLLKTASVTHFELSALGEEKEKPEISLRFFNGDPKRIRTADFTVKG